MELDRETDYRPRTTPERSLLLAVLSRAYWDLDYVTCDREAVRTAVAWFRDRHESEYVFDFYYIRTLFEFTLSQIEVLMEPVRDAEEYLSASYGKRGFNKVRFAKERKHKHPFRQKIGIMRYG